MTSPTLRNGEGLPAGAPARPPSASTDGPCACQLLTALIRTGKLIDEFPNETFAADDVYEELHRLRESVAAALTHSELMRAHGRGAERACPDDMRRSTRIRLELDVIHDVEPDELLAVLLARIERILDEDDVELGDVMTSWAPRELGPAEVAFDEP